MNTIKLETKPRIELSLFDWLYALQSSSFIILIESEELNAKKISKNLET